MAREKLWVGLKPEVIEAIDSLSRSLCMSRSDTVEVIIAVFLRFGRGEIEKKRRAGSKPVSAAFFEV
jgi:hypothetical protein